MLDLDTYVNKPNQTIINKKYLETELSGGADSYHGKYLKYKTKYLKLKLKSQL